MDQSGQWEHQGQVIAYTVKRTRRKTLGVYVYPDRRVQFRVPQRVRQADIDHYIEQCQSWVFKQLSQLPDPPAQAELIYQSGERHPYLGQFYCLRIQQGRSQSVRLEGDDLQLKSTQPDSAEHLQKQLKQWYRAQAEQLFAERLLQCWRALQDWQLPEPRLRLRWMKSRWGSCSTQAVITLNVELIKYDLELLDYVIVHELCHLLEFNHSHRFYQLMDTAMPNWRDRKRRLEAGLAR